MISSTTPGLIRSVQKFITEAEYLNSNSEPIVIVTGIDGKVLQAVNCTVQCDPNQGTPYDQVPYIWSSTPESPQLILIGTQLQGYSILSQTVNGAQFGDVLVAGRNLNFSATISNPSQGDGGIWVSLWYTIWPDKSGAF